MRSASLWPAGISLFVFPAVLFAATPFDIGEPRPQSYDEVEGAIQSIETELEGVKCGGWDKNLSVEPYIAEVTGLPGRNGDWDGNLLSGMARRRDENVDGDIHNDFVYPQTAAGLATACRPGVEEIKRNVWEYTNNPLIPNQVIQVEKIFPAPYFEDPVCIWRRKDYSDPDNEYTMEAPRWPELLKEKHVYNSDELEFEEMTGDDVNGNPRDRQSPKTCTEFCEGVNTWQYMDCAEPTSCGPGDAFTCCPEPRPSDSSRRNMIAHGVCSGQPMDDYTGACPLFNTIQSNPNVKQCEGSDCRCEGPTCLVTPADDDLLEPPATHPSGGHEYWSYFRVYISRYEREKLNDLEHQQAGSSAGTSNDQAVKDATVICYGFYEEFDPLDKQALERDRRCLMSIDLSMMKESQNGRAAFGQRSSVPDIDINNPNNQRRPNGNNRNPGDFSEQDDVWYQKLSGGFSLINQKVFEDTYDENLTPLFLDIDELDDAKMRATNHWEDMPLVAEDVYTRAFDDTGEKRILAQWWQSQQQAASRLLHPSIIRLKLPASFALGIDPEDPFFKQEGVRLSREDRHNGTVEIQIHAEEDLLGSALGYIERSMLLQMEEEPISFVVPLGSATELRTLSEQWCFWHMRTHGEKDCSNADARVKEVMDSLEEYADHIDDTRILRGELPLYASEILGLQRDLTQPIKDWVGQNIDQYLQVLERQQLIQESVILPQWTEIEEKMDRFTYQTNLPWCMNQRFTMPIYSLLDEWMTSRANQGQEWSHELPKLHSPTFQDTTIDFSTIVYMTGAIKIPVLKPVQVRVTDFPLPPNTDDHEIPQDWNARPLPDIAGAGVSNPQDVEGIRKILKEMREDLPDVDVSGAQGAIGMDFPPALSDDEVAKIATALIDINTMLDDMIDRYEKFWKSVGPFEPNSDDPDYDPDNKDGIAYKINNFECKGWDDNACQHVEMDLRERLQRIGSRPLVFLKEDFESMGIERLVGGPCVEADHVCTPLHPERNEPRIQWDVRGPLEGGSSSSAQYIDDLRREVLKRTLYEPVGDIPVDEYPPYAPGYGPVIDVYDNVGPTDISPPRSSSSTTP